MNYLEAVALIARADDAEKRGVPMTEENMKKLGYVRDEGGAWELPIPVRTLRLLAEALDTREGSPEERQAFSRYLQAVHDAHVGTEIE